MRLGARPRLRPDDLRRTNADLPVEAPVARAMEDSDRGGVSMVSTRNPLCSGSRLSSPTEVRFSLNSTHVGKIPAFKPAVSPAKARNSRQLARMLYSLAKELVAFTIRASGLPWFLREVICRHRVGIVLYHDPAPDVLERHLEYLSKHYSLLSFKALVDAIERRDWSSIPAKGLVVHFDDGYKRNFDLLPVLQRFNVPATFYLCSHIVGTRRRFWSSLQGGRLMMLRWVEHRRLLQKLAEEVGFKPEQKHEEREALSVEELQDMARWVDLQSHGRFHFSLVTLNDADLREELVTSKAAIEALTGHPCEHFSYPFGEFTAREAECVRATGYRTARTTAAGWNGPHTDPYRLRIVADMPNDASQNRLIAGLTALPRAAKRAVYGLLTRHWHRRRAEYWMGRRFRLPEYKSGVHASSETTKRRP